MNNELKNNRSLLASAGSRSLQQLLPMNNGSKLKSNKSQISRIINIQKLKQSQIEKFRLMDTRLKKLMMKLTFPRLRKMQALVRGFLVRRKIYPPKLEQYLLAKSVLNIIISNVIYRQGSEIIFENITYLKYEKNYPQIMLGMQKVLQNEICDQILSRVFRKQIGMLVQAATFQYAKMLTRPKITYGFNVRDPLQLLLFDIVNNFVGINYKEIVREAIQECAIQKRQMRVIDEWIDQYGLLTKLYEQIVWEAMDESIAEYIVENLINRMSLEGAEVIARVCCNQEIEIKKQNAYEEIKKKMMEWVLQDGSLMAIKTSSIHQ